MPSDVRIRSAMGTFARTLQGPERVDDALQILTRGAVDAIPGAAQASISTVHLDGTLMTLAPTDPLITELDGRQYELHEGPCYDAVTGDPFMVTFDLGTDVRWPRYGPIAAKAGTHAQLAVVLDSSSESRSALNVYASKEHKFSHESIDVALMFAGHASVAMGFVRTMKNLGVALGSRQTVGQAVGIIMERYQITEARAFAFLVRASQDHNLKLRDVAADYVTSLNDRVEA